MTVVPNVGLKCTSSIANKTMISIGNHDTAYKTKINEMYRQ